MTRTQIQLPDPLHRDLKRIAEERDWSLAEVIRRASESYARRFPPGRVEDSEWDLPEGLDLGDQLIDPATVRFEAEAIAERSRS